MGALLHLARAALCAALIACGSVAARGPAFAQAPAATSPASGPSSSALKQEYDAAFQETLRQPGKLDVLFRFATVATQTGDLGVPSPPSSACC